MSEYKVGYTGARNKPSKIIYKMIVGKSGLAWFVPTNMENSANNILVTAYPDWKKVGPGFFGDTISVELENGDTFPLLGGWLTNSNALYEDTGHDIRNKSYTRCVLGSGQRSDKNYQHYITNVFYKEDDFVLGTFERPNELAQEYADKMGKTIFYFIETWGGSQQGSCEPKEIKP